MSFSVSTCLSHTGLRPLGPTIYVYSDVDSYGLVIDTVLTSDITGENCPYILLVPDNTTNVKLFDPISKCFCVIPISNCDFDGYAYDVSEIICDIDGYAYDVSEIICDIDGYAYDVSEIICDIDGYVYDVSEIICDIEGYVYDVSEIICDIEGYVYDVSEPLICFNVNETVVGIYNKNITSSGTHNNRLYYTLTDDNVSTIGNVWWDNSNTQWVFSSTLGGGVIYGTLPLDLPYPISDNLNPWLNSNNYSIVSRRLGSFNIYTYDSVNNVFYACSGVNAYENISIYDGTTYSLIGTFPTQALQVRGLLYDSVNNKLYVNVPFSRKLLVYDCSTKLQIEVIDIYAALGFTAVLSYPGVYVSKTNKIYYTYGINGSANANSYSGYLEIDCSTNTKTYITTNLGKSSSMIYDTLRDRIWFFNNQGNYLLNRFSVWDAITKTTLFTSPYNGVLNGFLFAAKNGYDPVTDTVVFGNTAIGDIFKMDANTYDYLLTTDGGSYVDTSGFYLNLNTNELLTTNATQLISYNYPSFSIKYSVNTTTPTGFGFTVKPNNSLYLGNSIGLYQLETYNINESNSGVCPTPTPTPTNTMTPSPTPTNTQTPTLPPSGLYTYNLYVEPIQSDVCIQNPISLITLYSAFPLNGVFPYPYPLYTDINLTIPYTPPSVPYFLGEGCGGEPTFIIANPNGDLANLIDYCFNPCPVTPTPTPTSSSQVETTNTPTPTPTPTNTPTQITVYSCTVTGDVVDGTTMDFKISINSVEYSLGDLWKQSTYSQLENALNALTVGGQQLGQFTVAGEPYDNAIGRITVVGTNSYDYIVLDYGTPFNVPFVCT